MQYYLTLVAHLVVIILSWTSPFWISWQWVLVGVVVYIIGGKYLGYCPLTKCQFKSVQKGFYEYYLSKWGVKLTHNQFTVLARYVFPLVIALLAIVWQVLLSHQS